MSRAVDAVAEFDGVGEGLEVDVGRLEAEGLGEDLVDEVDDGGIVGGVGALDVEDDLAGVARSGGAFGAKTLDGVGPEAVVAADEIAKGGGAAEARADAEAEEEAQPAELGERGRLGEGGDEGTVLEGERGEAVFEREGGGDAVEDLAGDGGGVGGEVDEIEALSLGGGAVDERLGGGVEVDEGAVEGDFLQLGAAACGVESGGIDGGEAAEGVEERIGRRHGGRIF